MSRISRLLRVGSLQNKEHSLGKKMTRFTVALGSIAICAPLSACASAVQNKEDLLAAAGFTLVPANTPQRQASLTSLPPHKFVHQIRNGKVLFIYADPTICDCLYVGDQTAYSQYRVNVFEKNLANEQQMTAQMNQDLDWGAWSPGWYY